MPGDFCRSFPKLSDVVILKNYTDALLIILFQFYLLLIGNSSVRVFDLSAAKWCYYYVSAEIFFEGFYQVIL